MRRSITLFAFMLVGCGGELLAVPPPPPDDASSEAAPSGDAAPPKPHDCAHPDSCLDGGCNASDPQAPTALVKGQPDVSGLATDGTNVYWAVNQAVGTIMACSTSGCGGTPSVFAAGQLNPMAIAVDGATVYWLDGPNGAIMKCAGGAACSAPTTVLSGLWNPWNTFGAGAGRVFFGVMGGPLESCPENGCSSYTTVAPLGGLGAVVATASTVFWRDRKSGDVLGCDAASCTSPTTLGSAQGSFGGIAANACAAYWTDMVAGAVATCPSTGCPNGPVTLASNQSLAGTGPIAVDESNVYWGSADGTISSCELGGCAQPRVVAKSAGATVSAIALDGSNVYWSTKGAVWKISK